MIWNTWYTACVSTKGCIKQNSLGCDLDQSHSTNFQSNQGLWTQDEDGEVQKNIECISPHLGVIKGIRLLLLSVGIGIADHISIGTALPVLCCVCATMRMRAQHLQSAFWSLIDTCIPLMQQWFDIHRSNQRDKPLAWLTGLGLVFKKALHGMVSPSLRWCSLEAALAVLLGHELLRVLCRRKAVGIVAHTLCSVSVCSTFIQACAELL